MDGTGGPRRRFYLGDLSSSGTVRLSNPTIRTS